MAQGRPVPGEKYLHFKNKLYQIISVAYHSETMEKYVVYQALYGDFKTYIRPYEMFISEVDREKYPDVQQRWRFQLLDEEWEQTAGQEQAGKSDLSPNVAEDTPDVREREEINPWLDRFLDAGSFEEKYRVICEMEPDVTDRLIDDIALILDVSIPEGNPAERYAQLKYCAGTRNRYEGGRLR